MTTKPLYSSREGLIRQEDVANLMTGMDDFLDVIGDFYVDVPERIELYHNLDCPHFCVETEEFNVVHLNSILTYSEDRQKDLIVGTEFLLRVLKTIDLNKTTIILTHYSFDFLKRDEQKIVLELLEKYHVQLWFSGHEHDEILRKQRDYFFEFQCGNLFCEGEGTKSCIIVGEYDLDAHDGKAQIYEWNSPKGWSLYPFASHQEDRSTYCFDLSDNLAKKNEVTMIINSPDYRKLAESVFAFNLNALNKEMLDNLSKTQFLEVKNQLGPKLNGGDNIQNMENVFLSETLMTLNSTKRYKCYIYLDGNVAPFVESEVLHFFIGDRNYFQILNDAFQLVVFTEKRKIVYYSFGYTLSDYDDVDERLLKFEMIWHYIQAENVYIKMVGHEEYNLSFPRELNSDGWETIKEKTAFWIEQMNKISKIENYYSIKFILPKNASEDEYAAINILSDSIDGRSCVTLPVIPMKHPGFSKRFTLEEDECIGTGEGLLPLKLFGYTFRPVAQYMMAGKYKWSSCNKSWTAVQLDRGIPVRVEFELSYEDDKNRKLIEIIPFEVVSEQFEDYEILNITGELADFFERYIKVTHDIQEIWQLYLTYKEQVDHYIEYDVVGANGQCKRKRDGKIFNKVSVNKLNNDVICSGEQLVSSMDKLINYMGLDETYSIESDGIDGNAEYEWMILMRQYSLKGHFPISVDASGYCYYDLPTISYEVSQMNDRELIKIIDLFKEEFDAYSNDLSRLEHDNMMRNYLYVISLRHVKYYETIKDTLFQMYQRMKSVIEDFPELVMDTGLYKDYVIYRLNNEEYLHAFRCTDNIIIDYNRFCQEAERNYEVCMLGKRDILI